MIVADENHRLLSFNVINDRTQKNIDFFIISTLRGGVRSTIGTCHYVDDRTRQHFLDTETRLRTGNITYVITPIRYDGSAIGEIITQQFKVM